MLKIKIPYICINQQNYILDVLLGEFLGLVFEVELYAGELIELNCEGSYKILTLNTDFFMVSDQAWLEPGSMPVLPLKAWNPSNDGLEVELVNRTIPVLYGQPGLVKSEDHWHLNLDVLGSAFFMLSRYEELITKDRDNHDRFPAIASVSYKAGFLDRPLVDEYVEVLWVCLSGLWPSLVRKKRRAINFISCDVDWPFKPEYYMFIPMLRKVTALSFKYKLPLQAFKTAAKFLAHKVGIKIKDINRESIDWMMDVNEQEGNKVAFYFIAHSTSSLDTPENFDSPLMRKIFRDIYIRGHEIGVHPGYNTFNNPKNFHKTVTELKRILDSEGLFYESLGGRQHYLRWDTAQTPYLYEKENLLYDTTLGYADKPGFRCGTCHEFKMYDLKNKTSFSLKQRPLIVMECTVIDERYENLGYTEVSLARLKSYKEICEKFNGQFNLLWHNHHFSKANDKLFYMELIKRPD